jgi:hypothetical protein
MQEAWLLFDTRAIREAVGNPKGSARLHLPQLSHLEEIPDPKSRLYDLLRAASEFHGRRLKRFNPAKYVYHITECIRDFSPLRELSAFQRLESDIERANY